MDAVRIVAMSDTHLLHERIVVPDGDILIHAGDLTNEGTVREVLRVFRWLSRLPHPNIIVVPGNHDKALEDPDFRAKMGKRFPKIVVLVDETISVVGLKIHGSPWIPPYKNYAFQIADPDERAAKWALIPDDTDVLVTHTPAAGMRDINEEGIGYGCTRLRDRIGRLRNLRLHVCGHIHSSVGIEQRGSLLVLNAALHSHHKYLRPAFVVTLPSFESVTEKSA